MLTGDSDAAQLLKLVFTPACTVTVYHLQYETVGGQGEATTASGALMVLGGADPSCQGPLPVVLYAQGTAPRRRSAYDIANLTGTSGDVNDEAALMAAAVRRPGIYRGRPELRRVRHLDPPLSSLSRGCPAVARQ